MCIVNMEIQIMVPVTPTVQIAIVPTNTVASMALDNTVLDSTVLDSTVLDSTVLDSTVDHNTVDHNMEVDLRMVRGMYMEVNMETNMISVII